MTKKKTKKKISTEHLEDFGFFGGESPAPKKLGKFSFPKGSGLAKGFYWVSYLEGHNLRSPELTGVRLDSKGKVVLEPVHINSNRFPVDSWDIENLIGLSLEASKKPVLVVETETTHKIKGSNGFYKPFQKTKGK